MMGQMTTPDKAKMNMAGKMPMKMKGMKNDPKMRRLHALMMKQGYVDVPGASPVTRSKAKEMLRHGEVHGRPLTKKQRGLFGMIAGGGRPTRMK